ncbi:MAG: hypothetical protein ACYSOO_02330, partial [Planctomycetota bacterium]
MSLLEKLKSQSSGAKTERSHNAAAAIASTTTGTAAKGGFRVEFGPSQKDILNFTNQLAVMIRAGISLQDSLESVGSQI